MNSKFNLTVFSSSKPNLEQIFYTQSKMLIEHLNPDNITIVYGGGTSGIMGTVRNTWLELGGTIISSNVVKFTEHGITDDYLYENIIDRQKKLVELGDGYLILPGGYGTNYEMLEVITKNDVGEASKPIFIYNVNGIYDDFVKYMDQLIDKGFASRGFEQLQIYVSTDYKELVEYINQYVNK